MFRVIKNVLLPAAVIIAGFAAVIGLSGYLQRVRPQLPESYDDSDLTLNGSRLKGYCLGMEGLLADWYWMRSLQYIGGKMVKAGAETVNMDDLRPLDPRLLFPLLQNVTDLDPHFIAAYSYGAIVLPAIDPEKAIVLVRKGIADNPREWRLYQHLGYIYWKLGRYEDAAQTYEAGSQIPGSGAFMRLMAAAMKTEGGSRDTARQIFQQMLAESTDEPVRITAKRRLAELDSLDERDVIDRVLAETKQSTGNCPNSINEIWPKLKAMKLPNGREFRIGANRKLVDPNDIPYVVDQAECRVKLDQKQVEPKN